jgi:putative aldouronate transport system substrate-binding protein
VSREFYEEEAMKKRNWFPLALAALAGLVWTEAAFAGGGSSRGGAQQARQETGKLSALKILQYDMDNQQIDFKNLWFYTELEKKTGVHVEWDLVKGADWSTGLNLRFASMDLPDLIRTGDVDVEEYGVNQKLLVPLDAHLKDNMPNYYGRLFMNDANKSMLASDGKMYYIGGLIAQNVNHMGNHYINKTWLDKLGLAVPRTVDELTAVLTAFRDRDPNGNGQKDEIPFIAGGTRAIPDETQGLYPHFAMFGVPLHDNSKFGGYASITGEGKVQFAADYPGFRDAVEWLAMCYREKLLDMESLTQDSNAWGVKMNSGNTGFTAYLRLINTALTVDTAKNFVSILPPASRHGVKVPRLMEVAKKDAEITVANKYVAQTLQWLDAQMETETMMVAWNGPIREGGPIAPTMKLNGEGKYEIVSIPANNGLYGMVPVYCGLFFAPGDFYSRIYQMPPHRVERYQSSQDYLKAGVLEPGSYTILEELLKPSNADAIELSRLYNEIDKLMQESLADFIRSGLTAAKWTTFQNSCKNVGVERYIQLLQKYYDSYAAGAK